MQKTEIINVRLPKEIVKQIDSIIEQKLFTTRSEVIRHFIREYTNEQNQERRNNP